MPELAETFIIASQLALSFGLELQSDCRLELPSNRKISRRYETDLLTVESTDKVYAHLRGRSFKLRQIGHRGKKTWLVCGDSVLEVSLGMTGRFSLSPTTHDRVVFRVGHDKLYYSDIRKFGTLELVNKKTPVMPSVTSNISTDVVYCLLSKKPRFTIKQALTNQRLAVSGIGNYMVNEILFRCRLHPNVPVHLIKPDHVVEILDAAKKIASGSVEMGGCTLRDFCDINGKSGGFQVALLIHGCYACSTCGSKVQKIGSPTSHVCQRCQSVNGINR